MVRATSLLLMLVWSPWLRVVLAGQPTTVSLAGKNYQFVAQARHDQYDLKLSFAPPANATQNPPLHLLFGYQDPANHYHLQVDAKHTILTAVVAGKPKPIVSGPTALAPAAAKHVLRIKRRRSFLYVLLDSQLIAEALDTTFSRGLVGIAEGDATLSAKRYQPYADLYFTDDFMRTDNEPPLGSWGKVRGEWKLHSVKELHSGTEVAFSANPFTLGGKAAKDGHALVTTGHPFWDDYVFSVSLRAAPPATPNGELAGGTSASGIVFGYGPDVHYRLRWEITGRRRTFRKIQLLHVSGAEQKVLAEAYAVAGADQWYRVQVRTRGRRSRVLIDEAELFDLTLPTFAGGPVGLYAEGELETFFDDARLESDQRYDFGRSEDVRRWCVPSGGTWEFAEAGRATPKANGLTQLAVGGADWSGYLVSVRCTPSSGAQQVGLSLGSGLRFRWGGKAGSLAGKMQLVSLGDKEQVLVEAPGGFDPGRTYHLEADLLTDGLVKIYVDGGLELRARAKAAGKPALYALNGRGARFENLSVAFGRDDDFEQKPQNQIFTADPFMKHWSSSEGHWFPVPGQTHTFWHKAELLGRFSLALPCQVGTTVVFGTDNANFRDLDGFDKGYGLSVLTEGDPPKTIVRLARQGNKVAEHALAAAPAADAVLTLSRDGKYICVKLQDEEILVFRDTAPLKGTRLGLKAAALPTFPKIALDRNCVRDELFERALCDWVTTGTWQMTNRFACQPRWSHLNGRGRGAVVLWSKFDWGGDLVVEFYAGMRMRQDPEMLHGGLVGIYPRIGDLNVTICGDGQRLDSGYAVTLASWDRTWGEQWTRLYREGEVVAKTDQYLTPRTRDGSMTRKIAVPWVADGRPVHGAWYYIKLRKVGNRVQYFFDNELVFDYKDPEPLTGKRLAIWTYDQSMVVARVKVTRSSRKASPALIARRPAAPAPLAPGAAVAITCPSHPGVDYSFESGCDGWVTSSPDQGAFLELDSATAASGKHSLRLANPAPGGNFGARIALPEINLRHVAELSFDYRVPPEAKVNLYFAVAGHEHFLEFTGESHTDAILRRVGKIEGVVADRKWHRASFDLGRAVRELYPFVADLKITELRLGNFHEGYLEASLGGNGEGVSYHVDNFRLVTVGANPARLSWRLTGAEKAQEFRYAFDQNPNSDPTTVIQTPETQVTGTKHGQWFFHVKAKLPDGAWTPVAQHVLFTQAERLSVAQVKPANGAAWDGSPIELAFKPSAGAAPALHSVKVSVNGQPLPANGRTLAYDAAKRRLRIDVNPSDLHFADKAKVKFSLVFAEDTSAPHEPVSFEWEYSMDWSKDKAPPSLVRVLNHLVDDSFEESLGSWANKGGTTGAVVTRDSTTAASGQHSVQVYNPLVSGTWGTLIATESFDVGHYPLLSFDYCLPREARVDVFVASSLYGARAITFTDGQSASVGSVAGVQADGKWHHAEFDLRRGFSLLPWAKGLYGAGQIWLADGGSRLTGPSIALNLDNFRVAPAFSGTRGFELQWRATDASGIKGYSYHWSGRPAEEADTTVDGAVPKQAFKGIAENTPYFHIRAQDKAGNWGPTSHHKFLIDNTPPPDPALAVGPAGKLSDTLLTSALTDATAGLDVDDLQVLINGRAHQVNPFFTAFNVSTGAFRWEWSLASQLFDRPVADGTEVTVQLAQLRDCVGNATNPSQKRFKVDYASDKKPPPIPDVSAKTQAVLFFDTFARSLGQWANWSSTTVTRHFDAERKDYCLKLAAAAKDGNFAVYARTERFDLAEYPWISFSYRMPGNVKVHLLVHVNGNWRAVPLTVPCTAYPNLGQAPGFKADGKWHRTCFNLYELVKTNMPNQKAYVATHLGIGDFQAHGNPAGATYFIDDFLVFGAGPPEPVFEPRCFDPTGIAGYRYVFDTNPETQPKPEDAGADARIAVPPVPASGLYYLHLMAQDGAGNWSAAQHYPYYAEGVILVSRAGPVGNISWQTEQWADCNPVTVAMENGKTMAVNLTKGSSPKSVVSCAAQLNLTTEQLLLVEAENLSAHDVELAVALRTGADSQYFESRTVRVRHGAAQPIFLDLKGATFKSEASGWGYKSAIANLQDVKGVCLLTYHTEAGKMRVHGLRTLRTPGLLRTTWQSAPWPDVNVPSVSFEPRGDRDALVIELRKGATDKSVMSCAGAAFNNARRLTMDVTNESEKPVGIALGFATGAENAYFETKSAAIRAKATSKLSFDLAGKTLKCAASKWRHTATLGNPGDIRTTYLLIYHANPGSVRIAGLTKQ